MSGVCAVQNLGDKSDTCQLSQRGIKIPLFSLLKPGGGHEF